jgi:hypothetical protein
MKNHVVRLVAAAAIVAGLGSQAFAQPAQQNAPPVRNYTPAPKAGKKYVATKEIIFDKARGQLRLPTPDETQALVDQISSLTNRSAEGLTISQSPGGARMMGLEGRFGGVVLGRALADGTTEVRCVTTMAEAVEFLGLEESLPQQ